MRNKLWRQVKENNVANKREREFPNRYPGKTPGKPCSDPYCCGNRRKLGELTIAEMKSIQAMNHDIEMIHESDHDDYDDMMITVTLSTT